MNDDENVIHKYYAHFFSNKYEDVSSGSEYYSVKRTVLCQKTIILDLSLKKKIFECQVSLLFSIPNNKKLSSHIAHISEYISYSNQEYISMIKLAK